METTTIDISGGDTYSFATIYQRNDLDAEAYRVRIRAVGNAALASLYSATWIVRSANGEPMPTATPANSAGAVPTIGASSLATAKTPEWLVELYHANTRVCRALSRDGGIEVPRAWMPDFDPYAKYPPERFQTAAVQTGVLVTAGVVGVAAAVAFAVAWWARGQEETRAGVRTTTLRQQAAVSAATRVALAYVAQGKDPPPEFLAAITNLGQGEGARAWAVPLAIALPITAGVGAGIYLAAR